MYSTVENYETGGVKCEQMRAGSQSLWNRGILADFQWANQQRYSDLRPMWEGTEGTDDWALSSDSQMDAVDWLGDGRSKPQPCLPRGPSCLRRQEPRRVSRASFTKAWKLLLLSLRLSCEGKTQWQIAWLETYSKCNKTQLSLRAREKCAVFSCICVKMFYSVSRTHLILIQICVRFRKFRYFAVHYYL